MERAATRRHCYVAILPAGARDSGHSDLAYDGELAAIILIDVRQAPFCRLIADEGNRRVGVIAGTVLTQAKHGGSDVLIAGGNGKAGDPGCLPASSANGGGGPVAGSVRLPAHRTRTARRYGLSTRVRCAKLYGSGVAAGILCGHRPGGPSEQMKHHAKPAQFRVLLRPTGVVGADLRCRTEAVLERFRDSAFTRTWTDEAAAGYPNLSALRVKALYHPVADFDWQLRGLLARAASAGCTGS